MKQSIFAVLIVLSSIGLMAGPKKGKQGPQLMTLKLLDGEQVAGREIYKIHQRTKQILKSKGLKANQFELHGVTVFAKSRAGKGTATLLIGKDKSKKRVPLARFGMTYRSNAPVSFNMMEWDLRDEVGKTDEYWQLHLNGNIKIDTLHVHVKRISRRITIDMGDRLFNKNNGGSIRIARELRRMGIDTSNRRLKKVVLVAKSRRGKGQAQMQVGQSLKHVEVVPKSRFDIPFSSDRPISYSRVGWLVKGASPKPWRIHLGGNIKVKSVVVVLD